MVDRAIFAPFRFWECFGRQKENRRHRTLSFPFTMRKQAAYTREDYLPLSGTIPTLLPDNESE
jgi:hypothetical protein